MLHPRADSFSFSLVSTTTTPKTTPRQKWRADGGYWVTGGWLATEALATALSGLDLPSEVQRAGAGGRAAIEQSTPANSGCAERVFGRLGGWATVRAGTVVGKDSKRRALALVVPQRRWARLFLEPARIRWRGGSFFVLGPLRRMLPKSRPSTAARARLLRAARALRYLKYDRAFSHLKVTRSSWRRRVRACPACTDAALSIIWRTTSGRRSPCGAGGETSETGAPHCVARAGGLRATRFSSQRR